MTQTSTLKEFKTQIVSRLLLEEEVQADGFELRREGKNMVRKCPFHDDGTASFKIDTEKQFFKCFGCGKSGDVLDWIAFRMNRKLEGPDFIEVLKEAASRAGIAWPGNEQSAPPQNRPKTPQEPRQNEEKPKARTLYASTDKLKAAVVYVAGNMKGTLAAIHCYRRGGKNVLIVFRIHIPQEGGGRKKCFMQATRADDENWHLTNTLEKNPLYNLEGIAQSDYCILVEGELKVNALVKIGIQASCNAGGANAVAKTDWTPLAGKTITLWRDNDEPGEKWQAAIIEELSKLRPRCTIKIVDPSKIEGIGPKDDVVDFLKLYAPEAQADALAWVFSTAQRTGGFSDLRKEFGEAIAGKRFSVPLCWPHISQAVKPMRPGGVMILAGSPGASKSFVTTQNLDFWERQGFEPIALMMEDGATYHLNRAVAQESGIGKLNDYEWIKANPKEANEALDRNEAFISRMSHCITAPPPKVKPDVSWVLGWLETVAKEGHRVIVIDPITAMHRGRWIQEADYEFVMGAKSIMQEYQCSLFLTTHIRKTTGGKPGPITMDDLSGGQEYSKFTQVVLYLMSHEEKQITVRTPLGNTHEVINRTIQVMKARDSWGQGKRFGFKWEHLRLRECGEIVPD
jgi:hypothetical protein